MGYSNAKKSKTNSKSSAKRRVRAVFLGYRPPCMCGLEYPEQAHDILPKRTAAYRKTTELLHSQLVRKGRMRRWGPTYKEGAITFGSLLVGGEKKNITSFNHPTYGEVYTTEFYDIKSPSKNPYNRDSYDDLGLNQYFVGQSPYEYYKGDPGDDNGIYHDTSQIRGPARWEVSQCDAYSYEQLLSGKNLKFPFKIYEKITETTGYTKPGLGVTLPIPIKKETITGYKVEVIALIDHWENKIVDKEKSDIEDRKVYKDVSTSIYALADGGILVYSSQYGIYEALTFYASGNMKDQPTNLRKFVENWDKYYRLYVKEDVDGWVSALQIVLGVVAIAGFMFAPVIAPALGYASAGFGFALGTISVALSAASIGALAAGDAKVSKIFGILSGITGLAGALKNIFSTVGSNVASSGASTLSAASTASKMGMSQTSSLYLGSGAMNGAGASKLTNMSFSEVLKAPSMSFNEAINVSVRGIEASVETSLWSSTMDALKSSYKVYSNTKDVFKNANDFGDDEIPNNDDKEVKRPVALRFNGSLESMVGYSKEGVDDIGLMEGSTLYLRPSDKGYDFLANLGLGNSANIEYSLESRVLKQVYIKQIKLYKKAKNGIYNTRISKKRSVKNGWNNERSSR
ncbi:MAG: hypothetical protein SPH77_05580 [Campylobacter sp.]|uniref:hypothetical protein n=1 Tax=Campylobacter sp. TaxID=205 RepID=UPI002A91010E|nr:hypothetical protein [Campylobacter sp.]MDY6188286.1 hypothetical protein [Campylobacter sp.]